MYIFNTLEQLRSGNQNIKKQISRKMGKRFEQACHKKIQMAKQYKQVLKPICKQRCTLNYSKQYYYISTRLAKIKKSDNIKCQKKRKDSHTLLAVEQLVIILETIQHYQENLKIYIPNDPGIPLPREILAHEFNDTCLEARISSKQPMSISGEMDKCYCGKFI